MAGLNKPQLVRVSGVLATTRPVPGRGFRLTRDFLNELAHQFTPGSPLFRQHGTDRIGRVVSASLRLADDGETELVGTAELEVPAGFDADTFAGKGFSLGILAYGEDWTGKAPLVVGLDSVAFGEEDLRRLRIALDSVLPVYVTHYLQFAQAPPPTIVVQVGIELLPLLSAADGQSRWTILRDAIASLPAKGSDRTLTLRFGLPVGDWIEVQIPSAEPERSHVLAETFENALASATQPHH